MEVERVDNHDDSYNDDDDDDAEPMTSSEVLQKLEEAWLNEKFAPELLQHKTEYVECILELINQMERNIRKLKKGDLRITVHKMEIDRIRYIVNSYMRCRLEKIQKYTGFILEKVKDETEDDCMLSTEELQFAKDYLSSVENHFKLLALKNMPPNMQMFDPAKSMPSPNLQGYVFLRVNESTPGVLVDEDPVDNREDIVDLEKSSQHIMRYKPVADLLKTGHVSLI